MNYQQLYDFMLNNCAFHIIRANQVRYKNDKASIEKIEDSCNAFELSSILSIALCKKKEDIIIDISNRVLELSKNTDPIES